MSSRYAEGLSLAYLGVRVSKVYPTLLGDEVGDVVEGVLRSILKLLSLIEYHSTVDSNKDEKKREKQNTAKEHNILPKNHSKMIS